MREWTVDCPAPMRLDRYLLQRFPTLGRGQLHKALRQNKIKLNGARCPLDTLVQRGDTIRLFLEESQLDVRAAELLYMDEELIVALKPAGIPTLGEGDTLLARVERALCEKGCADAGTPRPCHRLDTGTSGLVLLARTPQAEAFLTEAIRQRRIGKRYLCVTVGCPDPAAATLRAYLRKNAQAGTVRVLPRPASGAREIVTVYRTLARSADLALLQVDLVTGRTHQIRAHLASIGCPVLGDGKYGDNAVNRALHCKYQALCAWELAMPAQIDETRFAYLAGRVFRAPEPWYCAQLRDGTLRWPPATKAAAGR